MTIYLVAYSEMAGLFPGIIPDGGTMTTTASWKCFFDKVAAETFTKEENERIRKDEVNWTGVFEVFPLEVADADNSLYLQELRYLTGSGGRITSPVLQDHLTGSSHAE